MSTRFVLYFALLTVGRGCTGPESCASTMASKDSFDSSLMQLTAVANHSAGSTETYVWSDSSGNLGWTHIQDTAYPYAYWSAVDGIGPPPNTRDHSHLNHIFRSPTWCGVTSVSFKANGGVSATTDPSNAQYLGHVLVSDAGVVTRQYQQAGNTHTH